MSKKLSAILPLIVVVILMIFPELREPLEAILGEEVSVPDASPSYSDVDTSKLPKTAETYSTAKTWLYEKIHYDHRETLYCGCDYDSDKAIDLKGCGYEIRKSESRAERVEAEHVMPASFFGGGRACWTQPLCTDSDGKAFDGRECCLEIDPVFQRAHNDLHNLFPSVGEVNGDRSSRAFGEVKGEPRVYGSCDVEIDFDADVIEPADGVRGDIARVYLYMSETYGVALSASERAMFESWSQADPPDRWEKDRDERVAAQQGNHNRFISGY